MRLFMWSARRLSFRLASFRTYSRHQQAHPESTQPLLDLFTDFVSPSEEEALLSEVAKPLRRLRYSPAHFDEAISGYRELRRSGPWSAAAQDIFQRIRKHELLQNIPLDDSIHVLDLSPEGSIFPHVDSVKFVRRAATRRSSSSRRPSLICRLARWSLGSA